MNVEFNICFNKLVIFKTLFTSVSSNPISKPKFVKQPFESAVAGTQAFNRQIELTRSSSALSFSSVISMGSVFSPQEREKSQVNSMRVGRGSEASKRPSLLGMVRAMTDFTSGASGLSVNSGSVDGSAHVSTLYGSSEHLGPTNQSAKTSIVSTLSQDVIYQGLLIRKHLFEKRDVRAKNRRWNKVLCVLRFNANHGIEMALYKVISSTRDKQRFDALEINQALHTVTPDAGSSNTSEALSNNASSDGIVVNILDQCEHLQKSSSSASDRNTPSQILSTNTLPSSGSFASPISTLTRSISPPRIDSRLRSERHHLMPSSSSIHSSPNRSPSQQPQRHKSQDSELEIFSLLHAYCSVLPMGYSEHRPFVFNLKLSNGSHYLFHAPNGARLTEWVQLINYWCAMKSKEPMRGAMGSMEYGWMWIVWKRKSKGTQSQQDGNDSSLAPSFQKINASSISANVVSGSSGVADVGGPRSVSLDAAGSSVVSQTTDPYLQPSAVSVRSVSTGSDNESTHSISSSTTFSFLTRSKKTVKFKIAEWFEPSGYEQLVSHQTQETQLQIMKNQVDSIKAEIVEHLSFREPMEQYFASSPSATHQAMQNWQKRFRYLENELQKFSTYVRALDDPLHCVQQDEPKLSKDLMALGLGTNNTVLSNFSQMATSPEEDNLEPLVTPASLTVISED